MGGTAITITGTSLTGATSVTVGGVAATSVVVVSSISITAVTPAGTAGAKMGSNPSYFDGQPNNPVEQVTWNMIQDFNSQDCRASQRDYFSPEIIVSGGGFRVAMTP